MVGGEEEGVGTGDCGERTVSPVVLSGLVLSSSRLLSPNISPLLTPAGSPDWINMGSVRDGYRPLSPLAYDGRTTPDYAIHGVVGGGRVGTLVRRTRVHPWAPIAHSGSPMIVP